jgi:hypothetical protein
MNLKKATDFSLSFLHFSVLLFLYFFFNFQYRFSFNFETDNNDQYYLIYCIPFFFLIILIARGWKDRLRITPLSIFNSLFIITLLLLFSFSEYFSFPNEHFSVIASIIMLFSVSLITQQGSTWIKTVIVVSFLISVSQVIMGILQFFEFFDADDLYLLITGSLQNSGVYSCALVIQLPFIFYCIFDLKWNEILHNRYFGKYYTNTFLGRIFRQKTVVKFLKASLFLIVLLLVFFALYLTKSRTALVAFLITVPIFLIMKSEYAIKNKWKKVSKIQLITGAFVMIGLFVFAIYFLFHIKQLSAFGRIMKWLIVWEHVTDNFWFGTGLGRFTWYYPQWQAQYFQTHLNTPDVFFLSAGESYLVFNEYLQLFKEIGLIGFSLFVLSVAYFFKARSETNKHLLIALKTTVIAILICGLTSYSFHVTSFLLQFFFCFTAVFILRDNKGWIAKPFFIQSAWLNKSLTSSLLLFFGLGSFVGLRHLSSFERWQDLRNNYSLSSNEISKEYSSLNKILQYDGKFLTEYGLHVSKQKDSTRSAVNILERAKKYFVSRKTFESTGYAYWQHHDLVKAIENFEWVANYIPNRFRPKYNLLKLYIKNNNITSAKVIAHSILKMPVKVPSPEVNDIKNETEKILESINVPALQQ